MANTGRPWSARENRALLAHTNRTDWNVTLRKLKVGRTIRAAQQQRYKLRHPELFDKKGTEKPWSQKEKQILVEHYAVAGTAIDLLTTLPRRSLVQIRSKAAHMGLKKKRWKVTRQTGVYKGKTIAHFDLVDQIRARIKEDGFSYREFDRAIRSGGYFTGGYRAKPAVSITIIARAVAFFEGTLVIDWSDR